MPFRVISELYHPKVNRLKKSAVLCSALDERLSEAFIRCLGGLPSPRYQNWLASLGRSKHLIDRTKAELMFCSRPQWVRMGPPKAAPTASGRGGRRRCLMSWPDEVSLVEDLERQAQSGRLVTVDTIVAEIEARTGKRSSRRAISDLLRRQGFVRVGVQPLWERNWDKARRQRKRHRDQHAALAATFMEAVGVESDASPGSEHPRRDPDEGDSPGRVPRPRPTRPPSPSVREIAERVAESDLVPVLA